MNKDEVDLAAALKKRIELQSTSCVGRVVNIREEIETKTRISELQFYTLYYTLVCI